MKRSKSEIEDLASDHWGWLCSFLKGVTNLQDDELRKMGKTYIDAFIHGYKHGSEDAGHD